MSEKKQHKFHTKDQIKHTHREAFKGHRTKKHFLNSVQDKEAEHEIKHRAKDD
jgi:hypothetical protein